MHRAPARLFPVPQPSTQPRPKLRLVRLNGEKIEDHPVVVLMMVHFLLELRRLIEKNRERRLLASAMTSTIQPACSPELQPEPEEVTGVHEIVRRQEASLDKLIADTPRQRKSKREWTVSDEAAGQFARCLLGSKVDLDSFLNRRAEKVMRDRMHQRQKYKPYHLVYDLERQALLCQVRTVVESMMPTSRHTSDGYQIRRLVTNDDQPILEAAICPRERKIVRIYQKARPRQGRPKMVRQRPYGRRLPRS
jgi:hypothetical protein